MIDVTFDNLMVADFYKGKLTLALLEATHLLQKDHCAGITGLLTQRAPKIYPGAEVTTYSATYSPSS